MKLLFLINHDIASFYALKLLLPKLSVNHSIWVWRSSQVGKGKNGISPDLEKLKSYEQCIIEDSEAKLSDKSSDILEFLNSFCMEPGKVENNINDASAISELKKLEIELVVSIRYGKILKNDFIGMPKHGIINLHSGILPNYRGVMATFWSMLNQESEIGTTLHYIDDASIDTGPIIKISKQFLNLSNCYLSNVLKLYETGTRDVLDAINSIQQAKDIDSTAVTTKGDYYTFPSQQDINDFKKLGGELVNEARFLQFFSTFNN
ncbi:MAG: formyl transferase [Gammaproteobacteria bacterium]|nr:formyl transferase [Gammaproteobacteria bacterium]